MDDVLEVSKAPVIFTHSSWRVLTSQSSHTLFLTLISYDLVRSPRNVPNEILDRLSANGGIIMISLIPALTHKEPTSASLNHVVDHMLHVIQRIGVKHVGIGSDFDGMERAVEGAEDVSKFPNLVACMLSRGIPSENVRDIIGVNLIRVMGRVEMVRDEMLREPVLEDKVKQLWSEDFRNWIKSRYSDF